MDRRKGILSLANGTAGVGAGPGAIDHKGARIGQSPRIGAAHDRRRIHAPSFDDDNDENDNDNDNDDDDADENDNDDNSKSLGRNHGDGVIRGRDPHVPLFRLTVKEGVEGGDRRDPSPARIATDPSRPFRPDRAGQISANDRPEQPCDLSRSVLRSDPSHPVTSRNHSTE